MCDVSSPFHETSAFEEDWQKAVNDGSGVGGLDLIAEFNSSCDNNTNAFDDNTGHTMNGNGIDPQLLSNPASPASPQNLFDGTFDHNDFAYPDFNQPTPASTPYFHSLEAPCAPVAPMFASSPLRNQLHRRSVSMPPEGLPQHYSAPRFVPSGPPMTFTRSGHFLGQPKPQQHAGPRMMKSLPKNKPARSHPYAPRGAQQQGRYHLRRSNTQPVHVRSMGPTSVPPPMHMPSPPPPPPQQFTTSRVCTPAPSPVHEMMAASPGPIDPMLMESTPEKKTVSIPVGLDELRSMITEAVMKAVAGFEAAKKSNSNEGVQDVGNAVDEDEIVVASVEG